MSEFSVPVRIAVAQDRESGGTVPRIEPRVEPRIEPGGGPGGETGWSGSGPGFADLLDIVNPLQHLPVVSTLYRSITGDQIATFPRLLGGALFGGPVGFAAAMAGSMLQHATGRDPGEHVQALLFGSGAADPRPDRDPAPASVQALAPTPAPTLAPAAVPAPPGAMAAPSPARPELSPAGWAAIGGTLTPDMVMAAARSRLAPPEKAPREPAAQDSRADAGQGGSHPGAPPDEPDGDWFAAAMARGLEQYERAARLGLAGAAGASAAAGGTL